LNASGKRKIKNGFILRNTADKIAMFSAEHVEAIKSIEFMIKNTGANAVNISFMTLPGGS
jgi:hypothetical protein